MFVEQPLALPGSANNVNTAIKIIIRLGAYNNVNNVNTTNIVAFVTNVNKVTFFPEEHL